MIADLAFAFALWIFVDGVIPEFARWELKMRTPKQPPTFRGRS